MGEKSVYQQAKERYLESIMKREKNIENEEKKATAILAKNRANTKIYQYNPKDLEEVTNKHGSKYLRPKEDVAEKEVPEDNDLGNINALTAEDIDAIEDRDVLVKICKDQNIDFHFANSQKTLKTKIKSALFETKK